MHIYKIYSDTATFLHPVIASSVISNWKTKALVGQRKDDMNAFFNPKRNTDRKCRT